jgi:hypothetical protein
LQPSKRALHNHKQGLRQKTAARGGPGLSAGNVLLALCGEAAAPSEGEGNPSSREGIPKPAEGNPKPAEGKSKSVARESKIRSMNFLRRIELYQ